MTSIYTDTGSANAVRPYREIVYDTAGGRQIEKYVLAQGDVASFYAGTLAPYTSTNAPFYRAATSVVEKCEDDGMAYIDIYRDYGYNSAGGVVDPTTDNLSVQVEIISQESHRPLSQIPYFQSNLLSSYLDATGQSTANLLKNIRLRVLNELLNLPRSQRPSPNDTYIPEFAPIIPAASAAWDKFLETAGDLDSINLDAKKTMADTSERFLFGRADGSVTESNANDPWSLALPVSWLLGGDENETPAGLQNGGSAWPEWPIYEFAYENGVEDILGYEYILRVNRTRSTAFASQQSLVNVNKAFTHSNIFTEIGVSSGAVKFAFSSDFTGGYWIKQAPQIRWDGSGAFSIRQDYIFTSKINSNFYALA
jgi:hypothetical protein